MKFKTYIQKPTGHKFMQWDGCSLDEARKIFDYLKITPFYHDDSQNKLCSLIVEHKDGHPSQGYYTPVIVNIGDYVAIPIHRISGIPIVHIDKQLFEQLYEPVDQSTNYGCDMDGYAE